MRSPSIQTGPPCLNDPLFRPPHHHRACCRECSRHLLRFPHRRWQRRHFRSWRFVANVAFTGIQPFIGQRRAAAHLTNRTLAHRQRPQRLRRQCLHQRGQDQDDGSQWVHAWYSDAQTHLIIQSYTQSGKQKGWPPDMSDRPKVSNVRLLRITPSPLWHSVWPQ